MAGTAVSSGLMKQFSAYQPRLAISASATLTPAWIFSGSCLAVALDPKSRPLPDPSRPTEPASSHVLLQARPPLSRARCLDQSGHRRSLLRARGLNPETLGPGPHLRPQRRLKERINRAS